MIRISNVKVKPDNVPQNFKTFLQELTGFKTITSVQIAKKSIDARQKKNLHLLYTFDICLEKDEEKLLASCLHPDAILVQEKEKYTPTPCVSKPTNRPVVVGTGPAGMMAALALAEAGLKPLIIERGKSAPQRKQDVELFWKTGELDENSNVQFGEGGAGTFSDGKLTTGIKKDLWTLKVLEEFVKAGAPEEIMYLGKPHIGTDKLFYMVQNIRQKILELGGEYLFETQLIDLVIKNEKITGVSVLTPQKETQIIATENVILAIGHSARDTFEMLYKKGVQMIQKAFAVGARIEHLQTLINTSQFGIKTPPKALGAADYKLVAHLGNNRSAYTFCMCPGGSVVAAASEKKRLVTNGMSAFARDKKNANAALLVNVTPEDFGSDHPLAGIAFQRKIEEKAFQAGGGNFTAPAQRVQDFLKNKQTVSFKEVIPSYAPNVQGADLRAVLPAFITETMKEALKEFDKKIRGFASQEAVLTAAETRTSSPVRLLRDKESFQCLNVQGLYPCGEGAGYAGGIMSAGVDGLKCANKILEKLSKK